VIEEEIRFHILYFLYNKHTSQETGKYQSADDIIEETGLKTVDRNMVDGEFVYLNNNGYLKAQRDTSDGGIPYSVVITKSGIDTAEKVAMQIIGTINNKYPEGNIHNEILPILNETAQSTKTKKIWDYVNSKPELFTNVRDQILRKYFH
jgi:hypothetical protein